MTDPTPRRGEVWFADVPGDKRRPVLVLSRDPMGRLLHSVICAPITTTVRDLATEVHVGTAAGLAQPSVANFDNTLLLSRRHLVRRLGRASDRDDGGGVPGPHHRNGLRQSLTDTLHALDTLGTARPAPPPTPLAVQPLSTAARSIITGGEPPANSGALGAWGASGEVPLPLSAAVYRSMS